MCGGRDRWRFDDKDGKGTWICSRCGSGDGFSLIMRMQNKTFADIAAEIEPMVGRFPREGIATRRDPAELARWSQQLWDRAEPVRYGDFVSRYLEKRSIKLDTFPDSLRGLLECPMQGGGSLPAMLAKMMSPDSHPMIVHRTFLTLDGTKANIASPRQMMPGRVPKGGAVRLSPIKPRIGIAEGIETALAVTELDGVPCWAALNTGNMMSFKPPIGVSEVVIYADNDPHYAGQQAAYTLAHKLSLAGVKVARVRIPHGDSVKRDWNDALRDLRAFLDRCRVE